MTDLLPQNGYVDGASPASLADATVQVRVGGAVRTADEDIGNLRPERKRTAASAPAPAVSLIIPVRNEARNIAWVLEQIADEVSEIILVDGNSTDATLITASHYRPDIKVVPQEGIGKGSALRTGFLAAAGDIIVMMDADGSMAPQEIRHYLAPLTNLWVV